MQFREEIVRVRLWFESTRKRMVNCYLKHCIEQSPVVDFEHKLVEFKCIERFHQQHTALRVWHHARVFASNIKIALIKFTITTFSRLITLHFFFKKKQKDLIFENKK